MKQNYFLKISKLLTAFFLLHVTVFYAQQFIDNGIKYQIISSTAPLKVEVIDPNNNFGNGYSGTIVIPATVSYNSQTYNVTSIGYKAFYVCSGLVSVTIPSGVTSIGQSAFAGSMALTSVVIPSTVTSIGDNAFDSCMGLTAITIPAGVTSLGSYAFNLCSSLTSFTCLATTPPTLGGATFGGGWFSSCNLYVPSGSISAYAAGFWANFMSINPATLGTSELKVKAVSLSPNPAKDFVTISNLTKGADVSLYDITGKLLYSAKASGNTMTINASMYKNGMYLVKVDGQTSKLLIAK